ncbi:MAG: hypothetical protein ACR2QZ_13300, partial [Woeseiaceae bacterium]
MKKAIALLAWVTLLMSIPTVLYYLHVTDQRRDVRENNLRTLSKAAETTNLFFRNSIANVQNLDPTSDFVCDFHDRQPYLEWGGSEECSPDKDEGSKRKFGKAILKAGKSDEAEKSDEAAFRIEAYLDDDSSSPYVFDVQWDPLLNDIPFSDTLELLLIADGDGNVAHQHRPEGQPDTGLLVRSLTAFQLRSLDAFKQGDGSAYTVNDALQKASSINTLQLSDANYELLCQPLTLPLDVESPIADGNWLLCGLIDSNRALRQSLLVAPFLAFTFFAVTLFGFLTWPVIKLQWMSGRDRLYFADLVFLLFGTWGGLMLATILILGVGSYSILTQYSETTLKQLALQIETNLQEEINGLAGPLSEFDAALVDAYHYDGSDDQLVLKDDPASALKDIDHLYASDESNSFDRDEATQILAENGVWPINSDFKMAFWIGPNGKQVFKVTPYGRNTPRVDVSHREYFKKARGKRLWSDPGSVESTGTRRFVQPIRSITTSNFSAVVSICSNIAAVPGASDKAFKDARICPIVAGIETVLVSTSNLVLPPGAGFAVIDDAGNVKFHSDERRALFENLYEEMDDGDRLESMVRARSPQNLKTRYLGRPRQVFVKPLDDMPWSIVTFSDIELISTANIEIVAHAAILALMFLLFYAFLTFCYFLMRGSEVPLWFWPGSGSNQVARWRYVTAITALVLVSVMVKVGAEYTLAAATAVPLLVFLGTYFAYRQTSRREGVDDSPGDVSPSQVRTSTVSSFVV